MPRDSGSSRQHDSRSTSSRNGRAYTLSIGSLVGLSDTGDLVLQAGLQISRTNSSTGTQPTADQLQDAQRDLDQLILTLGNNANYFHGSWCGSYETFVSCSHYWSGMIQRDVQHRMSRHSWLQAKVVKPQRIDSFLTACATNPISDPFIRHFQDTRRPVWVLNADRAKWLSAAPSNGRTAREVYNAEVESGVRTDEELADLAYHLRLE